MKKSRRVLGGMTGVIVWVEYVNSTPMSRKAIEDSRKLPKIGLYFETN